MDAQPPESAPVRVAADVLPEPAGRPLAPVIPTGVAFAGPRRVGWRLVLAVVLAVLPLLGIAGLAIAYHLYDRATRPDRSTPAVATYNYLQAFLNDGSQVEAAQFRCADASGLAGFESFWNSQKDFAASKDDTVTFSWLISDTPTTGDAATVSVVITQQTMSKGQEIGESKHAWSLVARKGSEWRICSATPAG